eukprot:7138209-Prymnesium_polylepis.2
MARVQRVRANAAMLWQPHTVGVDICRRNLPDFSPVRKLLPQKSISSQVSLHALCPACSIALPEGIVDIMPEIATDTTYKTALLQAATHYAVATAAIVLLKNSIPQVIQEIHERLYHQSIPRRKIEVGYSCVIVAVCCCGPLLASQTPRPVCARRELHLRVVLPITALCAPVGNVKELIVEERKLHASPEHHVPAHHQHPLGTRSP